jgi:hypothetical protein
MKEEDFLAVLDSTGPVQSTSHSTWAEAWYNGHALDAFRAPSGASASLLLSEEHDSGFADDEGDDTFGLNQLEPARTPHVQLPSSQLDDVLGLCSGPPNRSCWLTNQSVSYLAGLYDLQYRLYIGQAY